LDADQESKLDFKLTTILKAIDANHDAIRENRDASNKLAQTVQDLCICVKGIERDVHAQDERIASAWEAIHDTRDEMDDKEDELEKRIDTKADTCAVAALETKVDGKADKTELVTLGNKVDGKADSSSILTWVFIASLIVATIAFIGGYYSHP